MTTPRVTRRPCRLSDPFAEIRRSSRRLHSEDVDLRFKNAMCSGMLPVDDCGEVGVEEMPSLLSRLDGNVD